MVGESAKDILCAKVSECRHAILVKTGNSDEAQKTLSKNNIAYDFLATDLYDAVKWILKTYQPPREDTLVQAKKQVP